MERLRIPLCDCERWCEVRGWWRGWPRAGDRHRALWAEHRAPSIVYRARLRIQAIFSAPGSVVITLDPRMAPWFPLWSLAGSLWLAVPLWARLTADRSPIVSSTFLARIWRPGGATRGATGAHLRGDTVGQAGESSKCRAIRLATCRGRLVRKKGGYGLGWGDVPPCGNTEQGLLGKVMVSLVFVIALALALGGCLNFGPCLRFSLSLSLRC